MRFILFQAPVVLSAALAGAALIPALLTAQPAPVANPVHGQALFLQCRACHSVGPGVPNAVGPNLSGVVGRKAASLVDYTYSPAMAKSGIIWTPAEIDRFITHPSAVVPGTKMGFAGVADAKARGDIIAYLATLKAKK